MLAVPSVPGFFVGRAETMRPPGFTFGTGFTTGVIGPPVVGGGTVGATVGGMRTNPLS